MFNTYTCFGQRKIKIKSCCTCVYLQVEASKPFFLCQNNDSLFDY